MPFDGADLAAAHLDEPPLAASACAPWLDAMTDGVLSRLLAKAKTDRPPGASQALELIAPLPVARYEERFAEREAAPRAARKSSIPPAAPIGSRYAASRVELDGTTLANDTLLERPVELRGAADAEHLRAWAKLRSPFVQAVYALEPELAVLEWPRATSVGAPSRADLERALADLERAGLVHGAIDAREILVTPSGTLLRVPRDPSGATADDDREAVERVLARCGDAP
jgi:hypothetical protein